MTLMQPEQALELRSLPPGWEPVLRRCLARAPEDRFSSAITVLQAIRDRLAPRAARPGRRHPVILAALAAAAVGSIGFTLLHSTAESRLPAVEAATTAEMPSRSVDPTGRTSATPVAEERQAWSGPESTARNIESTVSHPTLEKIGTQKALPRRLGASLASALPDKSLAPALTRGDTPHTAVSMSASAASSSGSVSPFRPTRAIASGVGMAAASASAETADDELIDPFTAKTIGKRDP